MMEGLVKIELTAIDAERYKVFCRFYKNFQFLIDKKALETKNGSVIMYFDQNGIIQKAIRNQDL